MRRQACRISTSSRRTRQHPADPTAWGVFSSAIVFATCARTAIKVRVHGLRASRRDDAHKGGTYCTGINGHDVSARVEPCGDSLGSLRTASAPRFMGVHEQEISG